MTTKIVQTFAKADGTYVYLYRDSEWQEWQVSPSKKSDPLFIEDQMYHTSDKQDAIHHAKHLVEKYNRELSVSVGF